MTRIASWHPILLLAVASVLFSRLLAAERVAAPGGPPVTEISAAPRRTWDFREDGVTFDSRFEGARLNESSRVGPDEYRVVTRPENRPINPSAWFAFRVSAKQRKTISVRLSCEGARLRYRPKISIDATRWITLPEELFTPGPRPEEGTLRLEVGPEPLWVAAQEMIRGDVLDSWSRTLERLPFVTRTEIGRSVADRAIYKLDLDATPAGTTPGLVVIIGRQHPPETTGSQALMSFVETFVAPTPLARAFREQFAVLLVPLMNPDGVAAGHWRHNGNGVDTNRDWSVFGQPETRAVRDAVLAARANSRLVLHLDFHSTFNDVFYTQPDDAPTTPAEFTTAWLAGIQERMPLYELKRSASRTPGGTTQSAGLTGSSGFRRSPTRSATTPIDCSCVLSPSLPPSR